MPEGLFLAMTEKYALSLQSSAPSISTHLIASPSLSLFPGTDAQALVAMRLPLIAGLGLSLRPVQGHMEASFKHLQEAHAEKLSGTQSYIATWWNFFIVQMNKGKM